MRTIKFRGFSIELIENEWVYGNLIQRSNGECVIIDDDPTTWDIPYSGVKVVPESVGQFTGLLDKNGKEIYEGDILKTFYEGRTYSIGFENEKFVILVDGKYWADIDRGFFLYRQEGVPIEVIGNIYENKDFLEK